MLVKRWSDVKTEENNEQETQKGSYYMTFGTNGCGVWSKEGVIRNRVSKCRSPKTKFEGWDTLL